MYVHYYPYHYPALPIHPYHYGYYQEYRTYPPVDPSTFQTSVKSFRILMEQGSILLDKLAESSFDVKLMTAAQQGKQQEVDQMIKSIGLKVPVKTQYTPSGINFILQTQTNAQVPASCCSLTISMTWGN